MTAAKADKPAFRVNLRFVCNLCNDVTAMKKFYGDVLGMEVGSFGDTPQGGWLILRSEGLELVFCRGEAPLTAATEFAFVPGDGGGNSPAGSWSIVVPEDDMRDTVQRLREAGATLQTPAPTWRQNSYWGINVLDPMGNTLEVGCYVKAKPADTTWR
ncbi:MAG: VOC family protein [Planctomycetes bacterium]|nr:VOC family protein [Planctomycetota bacterium]